MKNIFFRSCCTVLTCFTASTLVAVPQAAANGRHITCGSRNYGYTYCRAYTGGQVSLFHQLSDRPCREGDSWGYDSQGIWVDKGCRADFLVDNRYGNSWDNGYNNRNTSYPHNNHNNKHNNDDDIGAALGVAAGAAILGAIIAGSSSSHDSGYNSHYDQRHHPVIPNWAIGTFRGRNSQHNSEVELTITPSGQVVAMVEGIRVNGTFDGRKLVVQGNRFDVERSPDGLTTIQEGNFNNQVHYYRYR
jgi:hypothetical protein